MNVWHALCREAAGVWRSVRYDLHSRRAARIANAYTEELAPSGDTRPGRRLIPLTGVALLLAGGAAGTFLAISGGLAALEADRAPAGTNDRAPQVSRTVADPVPTQTRRARALAPRRTEQRRQPAPPPVGAPVAAPTAGRVPEASTLPTASTSATGSATPSGSPAASADRSEPGAGAPGR